MNHSNNILLPIGLKTKIDEKKVRICKFDPISAKELIILQNNKYKDGRKIFYDSNLYSKEHFYCGEKPRSGYCIISNVPIKTKSKEDENDFLCQTFALASFIEDVIPEIKGTKFWNACITQIENQEISISNSLLKKDFLEASIKLKKLHINKFFRPNFCELFQLGYINKIQNGICIYDSENIVSNSITLSKEKFAEINFRKEGAYVSMRNPSSLKNQSTSFICSVDLIYSHIMPCNLKDIAAFFMLQYHCHFRKND